MFAKILKLILAGIVVILVPDDSPLPPPWYSETQEIADAHLFDQTASLPNFAVYDYLIYLQRK